MRDDDAPKKRGNADAKATRDARGRSVKGHCPSRKGRPRKKPKEYIDLSDVRIFADTLIDVRTKDGVQQMDRHAALLNKMFEIAMKGSVFMQRFVYNLFQDNAERLAAGKVHYERLMIDWVIENSDFDSLDGKSIPPEVQAEISGLQDLLHHYFPSEYPRPLGKTWKDEG